MAKKLVLFDVDGTLSKSRLKAEPEMIEFLAELRKKVTIGFVGGSDLPKQQEQISENVQDLFDYCFCENGVVAYKGREKLNSASMMNLISVPTYNKFVSFVLHYIADLDIPVKTGTFVELRTGLMNICPIGRNCTQEQRLAFNALDKEKGIRKKLISDLQNAFPELDLQYAIGGQISVDVFPRGWSKIYCLQFVEGQFDEIHFIGDQTQEGGNDAEIFNDPRTIGHTTKGPEDTIRICKELFF